MRRQCAGYSVTALATLEALFLLLVLTANAIANHGVHFRVFTLLVLYMTFFSTFLMRILGKI